MSGYTCTHCGEKIDIFGVGGGEKTASDAKIHFLGKIPLDPAMVKCGDAGLSFQEKHADSEVTTAFTDIAKKMSELV